MESSYHSNGRYNAGGQTIWWSWNGEIFIEQCNIGGNTSFGIAGD
jgi:hypothetical protein